MNLIKQHKNQYKNTILKFVKCLEILHYYIYFQINLYLKHIYIHTSPKIAVKLMLQLLYNIKICKM